MTWSCRGCADRSPTCHGICEAYLNEKAEHDRLMHRDAVTRKAHNDFYGVVLDDKIRKQIERRKKGRK